MILSISSPGAIATVTDGVRARERTSLLSSAAIRSKTGPQTIRSRWRKIRMLGYHGVSSRWLSHRQSGVFEIAIQTGAPSAPARCAGDESQEITRSRFIITAAVSMNGPVAWFSRRPRSVTGNYPSAALS